MQVASELAQFGRKVDRHRNEHAADRGEGAGACGARQTRSDAARLPAERHRRAGTHERHCRVRQRRRGGRIAPSCQFSKGSRASTTTSGPFGNGSKMKFAANLLVAIHNVAAAEAMVLAMKSGLDPALAFKVLTDGAGNSRMFQVRGPMMVKGDYSSDVTMKLAVWQKDMNVIADFAKANGCPTPLFSATAPLYIAATANDPLEDTGAVCAVIEKLANYHGGRGLAEAACNLPGAHRQPTEAPPTSMPSRSAHRCLSRVRHSGVISPP